MKLLSVFDHFKSLIVVPDIIFRCGGRIRVPERILYEKKILVFVE